MTLPISDPAALQPWGRMRINQPLAQFFGTIPTDFRVLPRDASQDRNVVWQAFLRDTLARIVETLWPEYDYQKQEWIGPSAAGMRELTTRDHAVLTRIQSHPNGIALTRPPRSPLLTADCPNQRDLFKLEDTEKFSTAYRFYDRELTKVLSVEAVEKLREHAMRTKVAVVSSQFKYFLQRPRPYQTALLDPASAYEYQDAHTASTPSMCSGHAVQCLLAAGGMLERFWEDRHPLFPPHGSDSVEALTQWAVDAGDRRVLGGVHYPSDNLCSWLIFLRLAERVYTNPRIKPLFWSAITSQSYVYREVKEAADRDSGHPYHRILTELTLAASN